MNKLYSLLLGAAVAIGMTSGAARAASVDTFDSVILGVGGWQVDRYAPAGFSSQSFLGDNRLELKLSTADSQSNRPPAYNSTFYNTQGRSINTVGATNYIAIDMYMSSSLLSDTGRVGGLWGVGHDALNMISAYPILELAGGKIMGWDSSGPGSWVDYGSVVGADAWHQLGIQLNEGNNTVEYLLDGSLLGVVSALGTTNLNSVIIQGINAGAGVNRNIYFDNLQTAETPIPGAVLLFGSVLAGGVGLMRRRARRAVA